MLYEYSQSVFTLHTTDPWMIGHLHLEVLVPQIYVLYGMVPYAVASLRLFGGEDSIVIVVATSTYGYSRAILLWRGLEPCDLPGVFLGFF